jgi:hypothetical protein
VSAGVFPFTRNRFHHALVRRSGRLCLVARTNLATGSVHWEVVHLRRRQAETVPSGNQIPPHDAYPHTESWGTNGWTYTTLPDAEERFAREAPHENAPISCTVLPKPPHAKQG